MSVGASQSVHSYPLSIRQYHRMIQAGILGEDDPVELLDGYLVAKMPKGPYHDGTISGLGGLLNRKRLQQLGVAAGAGMIPVKQIIKAR